MQISCVLCCDDARLFGITECNHGPFCYKCVYKMRAINKNNSCPICKHKSTQIMISEDWDRFGSYKGEMFPDSNFGDVFHCGPVAKREFQKLKELKCFVKANGKPCKHEKTFQNIAFLKKHLKEEHKRVLCDVCLQKKTCVLEQQRLYTQAQLNKHMQRGDIDDTGNIIFLHPYCSFCKISFFDEDEFKRHMNLEHMVCSVCGVQHKYVYYKDYESLETHYKISHYICSDLNCLAKRFIAFRTAEELKLHRTEAHSAGNKKIDGKQLCGFNYGGIITEQIIELKDKEGVNMYDQLLSLKKSRNAAIGEADQQQDTVIDVRDFYPTTMDEEEHYHDAFILRHKGDTYAAKDRGEDKEKDKNANNNNNNKKKKYIQKQQFQKQKPTFAKENQQFTIEQLNLIQSTHLPKLYYEDFESKLSALLSNEEIKKLESFRIKHNKRQMSSADFIQNFYTIMKKVSLKTAYEVFPHYLRTVQNEDAKEELELEYLKTLKKILPKTKCMLSRCQTYGDLFKALLKEIQKNLQTRINAQKLSIKRPVIREKQRLFQLIGVVRRLKTQQMAKLKFACNFGVTFETSSMVHDKIFKMGQENIQANLSKVPNEEFIDLYVFVRYCYLAITHDELIHLAKNKIHERVLDDFLFERPELEKKFGPKKQDLKTLDQKVLFQMEEEERNHQKKLKDMEKKNKDMGYHAKANFSLNDRGDFPELIVDKKPEANGVRDNFRDVVDNAKYKPSTYQKKINELFPSLEEETQPAHSKKEKEEKLAQQKKEKAWWEKINQPKYDEFAQQQEVVKIRKGKNKKQKWVSGKGFFGH